ncbi:MAG: hypothetical protein A4E41_01692 [Methanoregulaceae archaeon PtaU1.Bin066]|nr:MAG: hypothetical protein A4E41_01692 [Methanoregulaceae archaeon PtaU1.Bin066]
MHVETCRAFFRAGEAVGAPAGIGIDLECRPAGEVPDLPAENHDASDRAEDMAETAFAREKRDNKDSRKDHHNHHEDLEGRDRDPVDRAIERIDALDSACSEKRVCDGSNPEQRDAVFDPVGPSLLHVLLNQPGPELLAGTHRAEPPAPDPPCEKREDKEHDVEQEGARHNTLGCSHHDDNRGDVEYRHRDCDESEQKDPPPVFLAG